LTKEKYDSLVLEGSLAAPHFETIVVDVPRTFPELGVFHKNVCSELHILRNDLWLLICDFTQGPLYQTLADILSAFDRGSPEIGYVQGMSYLGGMLLLYMEPHETFICLTTMLHDVLFKIQYQMDMQQVSDYLFIFLSSNIF
jgi:hypothetical protein